MGAPPHLWAVAVPPPFQHEDSTMPETKNPDWFHYKNTNGQRGCFRLHEVDHLYDMPNGDTMVHLYSNACFPIPVAYDEVLEAVMAVQKIEEF